MDGWVGNGRQEGGRAAAGQLTYNGVARFTENAKTRVHETNSLVMRRVS